MAFESGNEALLAFLHIVRVELRGRYRRFFDYAVDLSVPPQVVDYRSAVLIEFDFRAFFDKKCFFFISPYVEHLFVLVKEHFFLYNNINRSAARSLILHGHAFAAFRIDEDKDRERIRFEHQVPVLKGAIKFLHLRFALDVEDQVLFHACNRRGDGDSDFSVGLHLYPVVLYRNIHCDNLGVGQRLVFLWQLIQRVRDGILRKLYFVGDQFCLFPEASAAERNTCAAFELVRFASAPAAGAASRKKEQA